MHPRVRFPAFAAILSTWVRVAGAGSMDPAIERLAVCRSNDDGRVACEPDDAAFKRLIAQYGVAFAPTAMYPARTTGFGGYRLALEASFTGIDRDAQYWRLGSRGAASAAGPPPGLNADPASALQLYSVKLTKGFGMGVELSGVVGMMARTELMDAGLDLRIALLEGFRGSGLGYVPDVSVGGGVRTVTGAPAFYLTVASVDARISKRFVFGNSWSLSPWLGYQFLWVFADTRAVDLTPGTDALEECHYSGDNVPYNPDPAKNSDSETPDLDGQAICTDDGGGEGTIQDFNQNGAFDDARLERQRLMVGARAQYEFVTLGAQFATDIIEPAKAQNTKHDRSALNGMPFQWTCSLDVGVAF